MTNSLLLMAYPYQDQVLTSFRYATGYDNPEVYTGDAKLTQISSMVNSTHYSVIFAARIVWHGITVVQQGPRQRAPDF